MILELVMLAALPVLWDIGRRFASRPTQEQAKRLDQAIAAAESAHTRLNEHWSVLSVHTDKLNVKTLQTQPISREPRIKR